VSTDSFAITYTVKNEERLLPAAISLAIRMGVARIYIFFDGTTDRSREIAAGFDDVVTSNSISPGEITERPGWIDQISPRWAENMDVRKRINTYYSALRAANDGIEWILCIDPDEVLVPQLDAHLRRESINEFLAAVPPETDQILLPNFEVVPRKRSVTNPFLECTTFFNRFALTDYVSRGARFIFRKAVQDRKAQAWLNYWIYSLRFLGQHPILMTDPETGSTIPRGHYLGYSNHKAMVRTTAAAAHAFDIHRWQSYGMPLRSKRCGALLHYDLFDCDYARDKFAQRPPINSFNGEYHRNEIARLARDSTPDVFERFFEENILVQPRTAARLAERGIIRTIGNVASVIA